MSDAPKTGAAEPAAQIIATQCLAVRARLLSRALTTIYDEAVRPFGIKSSQGHILVAVAMNPLSSPSDICRWLQMDPSTLSRTVERLRARGWIETLPGEEDGRSHQLRVTPTGEALLVELLPAWENAQRRANELLGEGGDAALRRLANAVWEHEFSGP